MKNIIKNIKNAIVKFFIHIFLIILYILEGAAYSVSYFCQYWPYVIGLSIIIYFCCTNDPVRL